MDQFRSTRLMTRRYRSKFQTKKLSDEAILRQHVDASVQYLSDDFQNGMPIIRELKEAVNDLRYSTEACRIQTEAYRYQIDKFQQNLIGLNNTMMTISGLGPMANTIMSQLGSLSYNLDKDSRDIISGLKDQVFVYSVEMKDTVAALTRQVEDMAVNASRINGVASDPVISRTIDDLRAISDRFDTI